MCTQFATYAVCHPPIKSALQIHTEIGNVNQEFRKNKCNYAILRSNEVFHVSHVVDGGCLKLCTCHATCCYSNPTCGATLCYCRVT